MKMIEKDTGIIGGGRQIIFANGKYYLVVQKPSKVCVSEDLNEWTEYNLNSDFLTASGIAYGNGTFVVCGSTGTTKKTYYYYSKDGINWIPNTINVDVNLSLNTNSIKFINNRFITVSGYNSTNRVTGIVTEHILFMTSFDGINWEKHELIIDITNTVSHDPMDIDYNNSLYVFVGSNGTIFNSPDLINWTQIRTDTFLKLVGVNYGKGQFIITGDEGIILTSPDGFNWTRQASNTDAYLIRSRYANGMYLACGYNGVLLQSIDGILWTDISDFTSGTAYGMAYNNINNVIVVSYYKYSKTGTVPIIYFNTSRQLTYEDNEDSSLFFFDTDLDMLGIVDSFISLRWRRKYFEAGEFEVVLPVTEYIMKWLNTDIIIMRNNYSEAGIIETIEFRDDGDNEEVVISGRFLSCLLERRIIKSKINFSGKTIEGMNTIVNAMTPFTSSWETEAVTMDSPTISFQATYKNVYDYLCRLSEYSNIGFRVVPNVDSKVYMFEAWKGLDRTVSQKTNQQYSFSDDSYNIEKGSLVISTKTQVNYVLVGGQGEDESRVVVEVKDNSSGFNLHETFCDQKTLSKDGLTDIDYKEQLKDIGVSKLNSGTFKLEVTATDRDDYKKKWDVGDIVNIKKTKWNIYTTYRIIEVEEIIEDGKKTILPSFGSPIASAWNDN